MPIVTETKTYTRTRIVVEVLSDGPYDPKTLCDVHYDITDGDLSGRWDIESSEVLTPEAMEKALLAQGSDPDFLLGEHYDNPSPRVRVEYDPDFRGGDYHGTGRFAYVPASLAEELGSVKKAFTAHTGLPAVHVIHYDKHERYDLNGKLLEDK